MDDNPLESSPASASPGAVARRWLTPAIIGAAFLLQTLNATVVVNALPAMASTFGVATLRLNAAITFYLLAAAVFLPLTGWIADRYGARRVLMASIALFAVSSLACGLAQELDHLLAARVAQGAAGASLMPVGRLILLRTTPKAELVGALAVLTMPAMLGPIIGPVLGGAIVTFAAWRWVFFMNLPIALLGLILVWRYVPEVKERGAGPVDLIGITLIGAGLSALIFGFENLGRDEARPGLVAGLFGGGLAAFALYAWHARRAPNAVIDLNVFRKPTFSASVIGGAFMRVALGANPFLLAMLLQVAFGLSAFTAGLMISLSGIGALLMKVSATPILRRFGFRAVLMVNAVLVGASFMAYALFTPQWPHWAIMAVLGVAGFLWSLQLTALNALAYAEIDQDEMSRAATTASVIQQLVQSVGIGMAATLLHLLMTLRGETQLTAAAIWPAFLIIGLVTMISMVWFVRLPADAGDEMNGRGPGLGGGRRQRLDRGSLGKR